MIMNILVIALVLVVIYLGFKNRWNPSSMVAGALAMLTALWTWFGDLFGGVVPPTP